MEPSLKRSALGITLGFFLSLLPLHALAYTYTPQDVAAIASVGCTAWATAHNQAVADGATGTLAPSNCDGTASSDGPAPGAVGAQCKPGYPPFDGLMACNVNGGVDDPGGRTDYKNAKGKTVFQWTHDDFIAAFYQQGHKIDGTGTPTLTGCQIVRLGQYGFGWQCTYDPSVYAQALGLPASIGSDIAIFTKPNGDLLVTHVPGRKADCMTETGVKFFNAPFPAGCISVAS